VRADVEPLCGRPQPPADGIANAQLAAIDTIVVLMLENRSFDNFFGALHMDPTYRPLRSWMG
jgi:hypothetical protein